MGVCKWSVYLYYFIYECTLIISLFIILYLWVNANDQSIYNAYLWVNANDQFIYNTLSVGKRK